MNIFKLYEVYRDNIEQIAELDKIVKTNLSCDEWYLSMEKRAEKLQSYYTSNNEILRTINEYCQKDLSYDEISMLYDIVSCLYSDSPDIEFILPLIKKVLSYYENQNDPDKLIAIYHMAFSVVRQSESPNDIEEARRYLINTISYKDLYLNLKIKSRRTIFIAYHMLTFSFVDNTLKSHRDSYEWFKKAEGFYLSPMVQSCQEEAEWNKKHYEFLCIEWLSLSKAYYGLTDDAKKDIFVLCNKIYENEIIRTNGNIYDVNPQIYEGYLNVLVGTGEISSEELAEKLYDYYLYNIQRVDELEDPDNLVLHIPLELQSALKKVADKKKAKRIFNDVNDYVKKTWKKYLDGNQSSYISNLYAVWVTNSLYFIDDKVVQERFILDLLIKKETPIYLHSIMVKNLSEKIFLAAYEADKELFASVNEDDMVRYVSNAALLHDIGKTRILDIINQHDRRLSDAEFLGIRKHPAYGAELISDAKNLAKYTDIILYHHKHYDGNGGYPQSDGNIKSRYRIIIDIISIADCLDAATDYLGRSYRNSKTADDVFNELSLGKGTKYNDKLVDIILGNEELKNDIRNITGPYRKELMYKAYMAEIEKA